MVWTRVGLQPGPLPAITQAGLQVASSANFVTAGVAGPRKQPCQARASVQPPASDQPGRDCEGSGVEEGLCREQGQPVGGRQGVTSTHHPLERPQHLLLSLWLWTEAWQTGSPGIPSLWDTLPIYGVW